MIASYSKQKFVDRVKSGEKIHTIRADRAGRWREGRLIQHWKGSPRNPKAKPYQFREDFCTGTQRIKIMGNCVRVDIKILARPSIAALAKNDGFDSVEEFFEWFGEFEGTIVHWTDKRY